MPADDLQVESFLDCVISHNRVVGRACVVREHQGRLVYLPDDNSEAFVMAQEGRLDRPFAMVSSKTYPERTGLACPDCVDVIVGLGRRDAPPSMFKVDDQGRVTRR